MKTRENENRKTLAHLIRSGKTVAEATAELKRHRSWGYKWWRRFQERENWEDLQDRSRKPKSQPNKLPLKIRESIRRIRSELEAEANDTKKLGYIGAPAIRGRMRSAGIKKLPSISSIERELRAAGMLSVRKQTAPEKINYPHLHPSKAHELIQIDILPRYLTGGEAIACFNAIDVVSRYPSGQQYASRSARNAAGFLWATWQVHGLPCYQQVDNEGCFSGGVTHPGVLGQVLRLALFAGVQLVFSPYYHPESNGTVERFHQDYAAFVWKKERLSDLSDVRRRSALFYRNYRASRHHSKLQGSSPNQVHRLANNFRHIPSDFRLPAQLPLTTGKVHFIRAVDEQKQIRILNLPWDVHKAEPHQGVWATLNFEPSRATLSIFDAAPDAARRLRLDSHPFPLKEKVVPLDKVFQTKNDFFSKSLAKIVSNLSSMS